MVKRIIDTIFLVITWVAIIGLVGSYTAPYVDPNVFYFSSLLGLAYHYLLIANLLLFFYWLVRWKRMAIISFLVILAGYPFLRGYYGFNSRSLPETSCDIEVIAGIPEKRCRFATLPFLRGLPFQGRCGHPFPSADTPSGKYHLPQGMQCRLCIWGYRVGAGHRPRVLRASGILSPG